MDAQNNIILSVQGLKVHFPLTKGIAKKQIGYVRAVENISFDVERGKTVGIVGESGCGKTTTGKAILRMVKATEGSIYLNGQNLLTMTPREHDQIKRGRRPAPSFVKY